MATFTVQRAKHITLTAAQIDTITLSGPSRTIQIVVHSTVATDLVAYRIGPDATNTPNPTSGAATDDDFVIAGGDPPHNLQVSHLGTVVVKVVSAQTPKISVQSLPAQDI